ncbi:MAG: hypothetical protein COX14_00980 [Chloroflexi bacterium CG23_combo_of_CG06-09_8_20_14_all_45_10]|nr:MAG: hypothetical protein COX14_00980 [Chloroflexi bacterium CG23_combo_of_CG06-09_8_20_14_all_45_10]
MIEDLSFESGHPIWNERYSDFLSSFSQIKLAILVLGPGQGSQGEQKRKEIKNHLGLVNKNYDVAFSEELEEKIKVSQHDHMANIALHISQADIIFALLVDDLRVSGALTELNKFDDFLKFREKTFLILPKRRKQIGRNDPIPLIWQTVDKFPKDHKFPYTPGEFKTCESIRNFVADIANRATKKMGYERFLRESGVNLPIRLNDVA